MTGIAASEWLGPQGPKVRFVLVTAPLLPAVLCVLAARMRPRPWTLTTALAALGLLVGLARHQVLHWQPRHHVCHVLPSEPLLTRIVGTIVTTPMQRAPAKLNQFLPFEPAARTQFVLAADEVRTGEAIRPIVGNVRVTVEADNLGLRLGQRVQLTGRLHRPRGPQNPGELDWARWYRHQGLDAGMIVENAVHVVTLATVRGSWLNLVAGLRDQAHSLLFEPQAGLATEESLRLLDVMVLGQRSAADRQLNEAFLRAGGMHFLAVSGFHVGILAAAAWWLVRHILRRGRTAAASAMLLVSVVYAVLAESNAPILRAAMFVGMLAAGIILRRPTSVVNGLALAAIGVLMVNPHELFRAGFQLSFVQVVGLVTVVPAVMERLGHGAAATEALTVRQLVADKLKGWLGGLLVVCVCAWLVSLPLTAWHFGRIAPWGWLGTFLLSPLVALTIVLSLLTVLGNAAPEPLSACLGTALHWTTAALLRWVGLFENLPAAVVVRSAPPLWLVLATYGVMLAWTARRADRPTTLSAVVERRDKPLVAQRTILAVCAGALLFLAWVGWLVLPSGGRGSGHTIHVLAVGNGAAILAAGPDGRAVLCDVGTDTNSDVGETVANAARELGIRRLDAVLISHANFDHYSGLPTVLRRLPVTRWLSTAYWQAAVSGDGLAQLIGQLPTGLHAPQVLKAGQRLRLGTIDIEVLWPPENLDPRWTTNDSSLVVRLTVGGRTVLLPGDVETAAMRALLEAERAGAVDLRADALVAPHHGAVRSRVTADFLGAVSPGVVLVSTRTPRPRLAELVREVLGPQATVLETGRCGALTVRIGTEGMLRVETPFAGNSGN